MNWLTLFKGSVGSGHLNLTSENMREVITEGVDIIMKQRRTDLIPRLCSATM